MTKNNMVKSFLIYIYSPDDINNDTPAIFIASSWATEISKQLKRKNVEYYILDPWFESLSYLEINSDDIDIITNLYNDLQDEESKKVLASILKHRLDGTSLFKSKYEQYFHPIVNPEEHDVLIDGGAFNGDTIRSLKANHLNDIEVHCFEPDPSNFLRLEKEETTFDIHLNNLGLWKDNSTLHFSSSNETVGYGCKVKESGDVIIQTTSIDNYCLENNIHPTYIKLDVEGVEYEVVLRAKDVITNNTPKLAISVYHKYKDLWVLYNLIKSINSNYSFYLGHHRENWFKTILYAIKRNI